MTTWLHRILDKQTPLVNFVEDAAHWDTCSIGEVCQRTSAPRDKHLQRLGIWFYWAVQDNNRERALSLYRRIQARLIRLAKTS